MGKFTAPKSSGRMMSGGPDGWRGSIRVIRIRALHVRDELDGVLGFIAHEAQLRIRR